jgi:sugar phosphate isomerase/epimerase
MTGRPLHLAAGSALDARPEALVRAAAAAGFDGVGLRLTGEHALKGDQVAAMVRLLDSEGVYLAEVEVVRIGDTTLDVVALFDTAAALGARQVLVVSDLPDETATAEALADLVHQAHGVGIGVGLEYMDYCGYPEYPQRHGPFDHFVSVIDLLFNVGDDARDYMRLACTTKAEGGGWIRPS